MQPLCLYGLDLAPGFFTCSSLWRIADQKFVSRQAFENRQFQRDMNLEIIFKKIFFFK